MTSFALGILRPARAHHRQGETIVTIDLKDVPVETQKRIERDLRNAIVAMRETVVKLAQEGMPIAACSHGAVIIGMFTAKQIGVSKEAFLESVDQLWDKTHVNDGARMPGHVVVVTNSTGAPS